MQCLVNFGSSVCQVAEKQGDQGEMHANTFELRKAIKAKEY
jgi:hypothetical protein